MSAWIQMRLFFELWDESAGSGQGLVVVVDAEEQEKTIAGLRNVGAGQSGMVVRAPPVEAEQHGLVRVQDLTKEVMRR